MGQVKKVKTNNHATGTSMYFTLQNDSKNVKLVCNSSPRLLNKKIADVYLLNSFFHSVSQYIESLIRRYDDALFLLGSRSVVS